MVETTILRRLSDLTRVIGWHGHIVSRVFLRSLVDSFQQH